MMLARARRLTAVAGVTAAALVAAGLAASAAAAQPAPARVRIAGSAPAWAVTARRVASPAAAAGPVAARVYLAGRNPAGLAAYAAAVSDPGSPDYRRYLRASQVRQRYGPSAAQVAAVSRWLTSAGLRVTAVTQHYVAVSGPASAAQSAFAVRFGDFTTPAGPVARAPEQDASVPASVAPAVLTVTGLDTAASAMTPMLPGPPSASYTPRPCSAYYGKKRARHEPKAYGRHVPWAVCGYTPAQLRGAYGVASTPLTGKGVTVAIVDAYASPTMPGDANSYAAAVGERRLRAGQFRQVLPASYDDVAECGGSSWYTEETLDIEAVHAVAPDADLVYVAASDCNQGLLDALSAIVDQHLADIVSASWGEPTDQTGSAQIAAYEQVFQEGAAEGIGFDFASGDCGYENPATSCGAADGSNKLQVDFPASSPWVTSVGGTSLAIGRGNRYEWEDGWGDYGVSLNRKGTGWTPAPAGQYPADYEYGSGGGTSTVFAQPSYQAGVVPAALSERLPGGKLSSTPMREVPDVAADADPETGFRYGETERLPGGGTGFVLGRIGGTSVSTQLFAGLEADAAQDAPAHTLGFANPLIYQLAGTAAFHDVTDSPLGRRARIAVVGKAGLSTTLTTFGKDGGGTALLRATKGYDDVTGVGSPTAAFLDHFARS
jgi:subtilase family serine protease